MGKPSAFMMIWSSGNGARTSPRMRSWKVVGASSGTSMRTVGFSVKPGSSARSSLVMPWHSRSYRVSSFRAAFSSRIAASRSGEHQQW